MQSSDQSNLIKADLLEKQSKQQPSSQKWLPFGDVVEEECKNQLAGCPLSRKNTCFQIVLALFYRKIIFWIRTLVNDYLPNTKITPNFFSFCKWLDVQVLASVFEFVCLVPVLAFISGVREKHDRWCQESLWVFARLGKIFGLGAGLAKISPRPA